MPGAAWALSRCPAIFHDYTYNDKGEIVKANCIIPTNQNHANIQKDMEKFLPMILDKPQDEIRLGLEMLVRAYDPCISCLDPLSGCNVSLNSLEGGSRAGRVWESPRAAAYDMVKTLTKERGKAMKKILIVDDDPDIVEAMRMVLEAQNFEVHSAVNGTDGLKKVKAVNPDLIILDVMMDQLTEGFPGHLLAEECRARLRVCGVCADSDSHAHSHRQRDPHEVQSGNRQRLPAGAGVSGKAGAAEGSD